MEEGGVYHEVLQAISMKKMKLKQVILWHRYDVLKFDRGTETNPVSHTRVIY